MNSLHNLKRALRKSGGSLVKMIDTITAGVGGGVSQLHLYWLKIVITNYKYETGCETDVAQNWPNCITVQSNSYF